MRPLLALAALPFLAIPGVPAADDTRLDPGSTDPTPAPAPRAQPAVVSLTQWVVPWPQTRPRDPAVDPRTGDIFFVGQVGNYVARFSPRTGRVQRWTLPPGTLPHNVIVAPSGAIWYAGNGNGTIGRMDAETGATSILSMPDSTARDPHTLVWGRDGTIWFTVQVGNFVGRLDPGTGRIRLVRVPTPRARPYGIALDSKGQPWIAEFGTNKIATLDPATMELREITLADSGARPRRIAVTPDDMVWYVDYARGYIGRLNPATGEMSEWKMPAGARSAPYAMATDDRGRLWAVETGVQPNRLVGFDPATEQFFSVTQIPATGRNTVRNMVWDAPTRSLWFGTDVNMLARATIP